MKMVADRHRQALVMSFLALSTLMTLNLEIGVFSDFLAAK